jgi:hypothetical protein
MRNQEHVLRDLGQLIEADALNKRDLGRTAVDKHLIDRENQA